MKQHEHVRFHLAKRLTEADIDRLRESIKDQFPDAWCEYVQDDETDGYDVAIEHVGTAYVTEESDPHTRIMAEFVRGDQAITIIEPD
jgi:hypothetical protein